MTPVLELEAVHAYYDKSHVLQGVSMRVGPGEIVSSHDEQHIGLNGAERIVIE